MAMIATNNTAGILDIYMSAGKRLEIAAAASVNLLESFSRVEIANSDIAYHIDQGDISLNDGVNDLSKLNAIKWAHDSPVSQPLQDMSGKLIVHSTVRKAGQKFVWSGEGDNSDDPYNIWGGEELHYCHNIGMPDKYSQYIDLNTVANITYMQEGYLHWMGTKADWLTADIVPRVTTVTASSGTYYNLYSGYLVVPAAGDGTIQVTSDITAHDGGLIFMPKNEFGVRPQAFWNANWNPATKVYENIAAAPYGDGVYNMFASEIILQCFIHELRMVGDSSFTIRSQDADKIGHGMRLRINYHTNTASGIGDHDWMVACIMTLHRENTTMGYDPDDI